MFFISFLQQTASMRLEKALHCEPHCFLFCFILGEKGRGEKGRGDLNTLYMYYASVSEVTKIHSKYFMEGSCPPIVPLDGWPYCPIHSVGCSPEILFLCNSSSLPTLTRKGNLLSRCVTDGLISRPRSKNYFNAVYVRVTIP